MSNCISGKVQQTHQTIKSQFCEEERRASGTVYSG